MQTFYIDRTFSLTPPLFSQIFFIVVKILLHQYNNTPDFALSVRMIVSLTFVRPQDIDLA
ncbi:hypothetical protein MXB_1928 [Myxobolus squamalis]|nr:hypothetical protein MXB_1928 [Myxobolus squamalis]